MMEPRDALLGFVIAVVVAFAIFGMFVVANSLYGEIVG